MEFHGEVKFGRNSNRRPRNPGFPVRGRSWLWFEGLRRKLGRWSSSGCGGFEIHGGNARIWPVKGDGAQASPMASGGRGRVNQERESEGVGAGG
jgi:hypothetical protein